MNKIPYFKQEKIWSCGPACFRMVLATFGIKKSSKQVIKLLDSNPRWGTKNRSFVKVAERLKWSYVVIRNATFSELRRAYREGYVIIVNYYLEKEDTGHYAVVEAINRKSLVLLDPWKGRVRYTFEKFDKYWGTCDLKLSDKDIRWFLAVKK